MRRAAFVLLGAVLVVAVLGAYVCAAQEPEEGKVDAKPRLDKAKPGLPPGPKDKRPFRPGMGMMMGRPGPVAPAAPVAAVYADGYLYIVRNNTVYKINTETMVVAGELQFAEDEPMGPPFMPGGGLAPPGEGPPMPPLEAPKPPAKPKPADK
jgi:hypothetical protein